MPYFTFAQQNAKTIPDPDASFRSAEARKQPRVGCNGHMIIRGHKGQSSAGSRCRCFQNSAKTRCRGFITVLESRCRGFLSPEKMSWNHDVVGYLSLFPDVVVFRPCNLDVVAFWSWNLDIVVYDVLVFTKSINMAHNFTIKLTK